MHASVHTDPKGHHIPTRGVRPSTRTQSLQEHTGVTGMFYIRRTLRLKLFIARARTLLWSSPVNTLLLSALSLTGPTALPGLGGREATRSNPGPLPSRSYRARGGSSRTTRVLGFLFPKKVVTAGRGPAGSAHRPLSLRVPREERERRREAAAA